MIFFFFGSIMDEIKLALRTNESDLFKYLTEDVSLGFNRTPSSKLTLYKI